MKELNAILGLRSDPAPSGADTAAPAPSPAAPEPTPGPRARVRIPRRTGYAIVLLLAACATASTPSREPASLAPPLTVEERALAFSLEAPAIEELDRALNLWATHYHTPSITPAHATISAAFPLIGRNGQPISPPLLHRDWCEAALQGSVSIQQGETATAYVFVDSKGPEQANCDQWLGSLSDGVKNATRRARFMKVNHPLGCGVRNHPLVPFRTIAVDPDTIPLDTVIYVPELRGRIFQMNGRAFVHDGYLFAGDRGGAIKGAHIDVFLVESAAGPLEDLFASTASRTFKAHILDEDHPGAEAVRATQTASCEPVSADQ
jgi:3D (Asp-Asp-Asp) domain-containing protein